jgi:hypothetical protein
MIARAVRRGGRRLLMTPEQRYLLDAQGYCILRGALSNEEVAAARRATDEHVAAQEAADIPGGDPLPAGFEAGNGGPDAPGSRMIYSNGPFWSKDLERLLFHRSTWPIVLELTGGRPQLNGGVTLYDDWSRGPTHSQGGFLHCKRDNQKRNTPDVEPVYCRARDDGTIESDNFVSECDAPCIVFLVLWIMMHE